MKSFVQVFAAHTNQEFPPKFVLCINDELEIRSIKVDDIPLMDADFDYLGDTINSEELSVMYGSLPMIARKNGS